jgi:hypothetical protein
MDTTIAKELSRQKKGKAQRMRQKMKQMNNADSLNERPLDKITEHTKGKYNRIYYRVRWEGCGPEEDSWLPVDAFYTRECLEDYWRTANCPANEVPKAFRFVRHQGAIRPPKKRLKLIVKPPSTGSNSRQSREH